MSLAKVLSRARLDPGLEVARMRAEARRTGLSIEQGQAESLPPLRVFEQRVKSSWKSTMYGKIHREWLIP